MKQAVKIGEVKVIGLSLPRENRAYVKDGVTQAIILGKPFAFTEENIDDYNF